MTLKGMEKELRDARDRHLTEAELDSYLDQGLDKISMARVKAHLKDCLICEEGLKLLEEERAELGQEITAEDIALAKRLIRQIGLQPDTATTKPVQATTVLSLSERLAEYLQQACESWRAHFIQMKAVRGAGDSREEVWQWKSEDGALKSRAILKKNGDLTIQFSSNELGWEGKRIKVSFGSFIQEITLLSASEWEVSARMELPLRKRPKKLEDISIEVL